MSFTRTYLHLLGLLLLTVVVFGCSKKKNNFVSRTYHGTTTHFNGFFNARELVDVAVTDLKDNRQENWEEPLPIFIFPTEEKASNLFPVMDQSIEKCSRMIDRHSMLIKKKQYNPWIDDCYLLIGQSHMYKRNFGEAEEMFKYVKKQFKKEPIRYNADLWLARLNIEKGNYTKAQTILLEMDENKDKFPKGLDREFYETEAHLSMLKGEWDPATEEIKKAIRVTKKKKDRARQTFILAQLYDKLGKSQKSIARYAEVVKMNPGYEMKFYAQINQALAFDSRSDASGVRQVMAKMLKDEKYVEFRDQIYYALAEVEFAERNVNEGIADLLKSTEVSVNNPKQKGKSFYRLADIYLEERQYEKASAFFDSTMAYIPTDYPSYDIIKKTKESLSDLVYWIRMATYEDSVQALASLDEEELKKELRGIIRAAREKENERIAQEQIDELNRISARNDVRDEQRRAGSAGNSGKWYFYNENSKAIGMAEFDATFGKRPLQDNWRRKNRSQDGFATDESGEPVEGETVSVGKQGVIPTMEELMAALPLTEEELKASNDSIAHALFEIGRIYKDKLGDFDNAIENFEDLNVRFEGNQYEQMTYYHLYRLFLKKEEDPSYFAPDSRSTSAYYKSLITTEFPNSEFARIINDPDYATNNEQDAIVEAEEYEATYRKYRQRNYGEVMVACMDVMTNEPQNRLLAKYSLLRAMAIGNKKDRTNFIKALREVVQKYPGTEEEVEAKRLLGLLDVASLPTDTEMTSADAKDKKSGDPNEPIGKDDKGGKDTQPEEDPNKPKGEYVFKESTDHYFALMVPNKGTSISDIKVKVSDFNTTYFSTASLKTTNSFINADSQVILVRTMGDKAKAMDYYTAFVGNESELAGVNDQDYEAFVMSSKNFAEMFKKKDVSGYIQFFNDNYLK